MSSTNSPDTSYGEVEVNESDPNKSEVTDSMKDYYQLRQELLVYTLVLTGIFFIPIWVFYSLNTALNYLIGACAGVVYLKMLARSVERLGKTTGQIGKAQLVVVVGLIVVASQWDQLQILTVFLGFLTYKAAVIVYMFRILFGTSS